MGVNQTAAYAPGEAQPATDADVLPKDSAWRGWLWILLAGLLDSTLVRGLRVV
jgi:hypothetical protein